MADFIFLVSSKAKYLGTSPLLSCRNQWNHSIKRKIMRHRKMETKEEINKQSADIRQSCWRPAARVSSAPMFIRSLQMGFIGLFLCLATAWAGPASIQGIVKDAKGQPIKGADVRVAIERWQTALQYGKNRLRQGRYISQGLPLARLPSFAGSQRRGEGVHQNTQTKADRADATQFRSETSVGIRKQAHLRRRESTWSGSRQARGVTWVGAGSRLTRTAAPTRTLRTSRKAVPKHCTEHKLTADHRPFRGVLETGRNRERLRRTSLTGVCNPPVLRLTHC